jgi:hypothetical protein
MKAAELFIGIVDFFSTLLPGAFLVASMKAGALQTILGGQDAAVTWHVPPWVLLVAVSYAVGQLLHLAGAKVSGWIYPAIFNHFKPTNYGEISTRAAAVLSRAFPVNVGDEIPRRSSAVLRIVNPGLALEADRLEAAAKFARGFGVVAVVLAIRGAAHQEWLVLLSWLIVAILSFVRFIDRRLIQQRYVCELIVLVTTFKPAFAAPAAPHEGCSEVSEG